MDLTKSSIINYGSVSIEVIHDADVVLDMENIGYHGFLTVESARRLFDWDEPLELLPGEITEGQKIDSDTISFETFERLVLWQAEKGNPSAKAILAASFRNAFRSISIEQVSGSPVPLEDRQRKIESDRNAFYAQYAAGISDQEWLEQSGVGSMLGLDMGKTSHWIAFDSGYVPSFLSATVTSGKDPDEILEEMRQKYE